MDHEVREAIHELTGDYTKVPLALSQRCDLKSWTTL
jgi:hypothetical protein